MGCRGGCSPSSLFFECEGLDPLEARLTRRARPWDSVDIDAPCAAATTGPERRARGVGLRRLHAAERGAVPPVPGMLRPGQWGGGLRAKGEDYEKACFFITLHHFAFRSPTSPNHVATAPANTRIPASPQVSPRMCQETGEVPQVVPVDFHLDFLSKNCPRELLSGVSFRRSN